MKIFTIFITLIGIISITSCNKDEEKNNASISGTISYNGNYTGNNNTIYIRGYVQNVNAIGEPDYFTSISKPGSYTLDLESYSGSIYISAFMDTDNTGSFGGPTANDIFVDGIYANPMGCYGDYTFSNTGLTELQVNGELNNIDFELTDSGVIKVSFTDNGNCTFGTIDEQLISAPFLHHRHCSVINTNDVFLLAVPSKNQWNCKVKFDEQPTAILYPEAINVSVNNITEIHF